MKGRLIVLDHHKGQQVAALMVDGRLDDLWFDTDAPRPGTIYRAIADRPVKGMGGMFVKTPTWIVPRGNTAAVDEGRRAAWDV